VESFLSFSKNQGEKSMTEQRDCIFCWESDDPETLQPLFPGPVALSDVEPTAWVHKRCLEEYSNPTGDDAEEVSTLGKMIDVDDDDQEYVVAPLIILGVTIACPGLNRVRHRRSRGRSASPPLASYPHHIFHKELAHD
jgi:hypothetical protein